MRDSGESFVCVCEWGGVSLSKVLFVAGIRPPPRVAPPFLFVRIASCAPHAFFVFRIAFGFFAFAPSDPLAFAFFVFAPFAFFPFFGFLSASFRCNL